MNKVKTVYKIQAVVILALIIALIACFTLGGTASADTIHPDNEYGNMSLSTIFFAYARNGLQKMIPVAGVQLKIDVDYVPSTDTEYDNYVVRMDVNVGAGTKWTLKRFTMMPGRYNNSEFKYGNDRNNHGQSTIPEDLYFYTGITTLDGVSFNDADIDVTKNSNNQINFEFLSQFPTPSGASEFEISSVEYPNNDNKKVYLDGYAVKPMVIRRYGRSNSTSSSDLKNDRGKNYTAVYYATYKVKKGVKERHFGFVFNQLEIWGQAGEPSFKLNDNTDKLTVNFYWENEFDNKIILADFSDTEGSQYISKAVIDSSLKKIEESNTAILFKEWS